MQLTASEKLVRFAQLVEQKTRNPDFRGLRLPYNHIIFGWVLISCIKPDVLKTLNVNISGYAINVIIEL